MNTRRFEMGRLVAGTPPPAPIAPAAELRLGSTADLRTFLLQQMRAVATGAINAEQVKSICALSEQVYKTAKLEIEFANALNRMNLAPVQLGHDEDRGE